VSIRLILLTSCTASNIFSDNVANVQPLVVVGEQSEGLGYSWMPCHLAIVINF
jgi:hypothetical protein